MSEQSDYIKSTQRKTFYDLSKGIAILIVIFTHVWGLYKANSSIQNSIMVIAASLHNPTFYLISGILFKGTVKKYSKKTIIGDKFLNLFLVFGIWVVIYSAYLVALNYFIYKQPLNMVSYVLQGINSLWFLPTLFAGMMIILFVEWLYKSIFRSSNVWLLIIEILWIATIVFFSLYVSSLAKTVAFSYIIWKGYRQELFSKLNRIENVVWIIAIIYIGIAHPIETVDNFTPGVKLLFIMGLNICGSTLVPSILKYVTEIKKVQFNPSFLSHFGKNTIYLYILHFGVLYILEMIHKINALECVIGCILCIVFPYLVKVVVGNTVINKILFKPSALLGSFYQKKVSQS